MSTQLRVLVIEDNSSWQAIYRDFLSALGYTVSVAVSKKEALHKLKQSKFDAFVIDIALDLHDENNKDGLDILIWLSKRRRADRAIMNSSYFEREVRQEIDLLCPCAVINKTDENRFDQLAKCLARAVTGICRVK